MAVWWLFRPRQFTALPARADDTKAVAKIYAAKSRPEINPLIVHVRDLDQARELCSNSASLDAEMLAKKCWPGPLTLVLPIKEGARLAPAVTAGLPTVAIRVPEHPVMLDLLQRLDFPAGCAVSQSQRLCQPDPA